jgi:hypothetical protein
MIIGKYKGLDPQFDPVEGEANGGITQSLLNDSRSNDAPIVERHSAEKTRLNGRV